MHVYIDTKAVLHLDDMLLMKGKTSPRVVIKDLQFAPIKTCLRSITRLTKVIVCSHWYLIFVIPITISSWQNKSWANQNHQAVTELKCKLFYVHIIEPEQELKVTLDFSLISIIWISSRFNDQGICQSTVHCHHVIGWARACHTDNIMFSIHVYLQ